MIANLMDPVPGLCETRARGHRPVDLTLTQILAWADAHHACTGQWPTAVSGPVAGIPGETWSAVNRALREGLRGLPGGDSLSRLLRRAGRTEERRGRPPQPDRHLKAARLRAQGLSLAEVGARLGVSRQAAWDLLRRTAGHLPETLVFSPGTGQALPV